MLNRNIGKTILFVGIFVCTVPLAAHAGNVGELNAITNAADKICGTVPTVGKNTNVNTEGKIKAELSKLAWKLLDIGVSVKADYADKTYQGLMQQDLVEALKNNSDCKIKVVEILKASTSSSPQSNLHDRDAQRTGPIEVQDAKECPRGYMVIDNSSFVNNGVGISAPVDAKICIVKTSFQQNGTAYQIRSPNK